MASGWVRQLAGLSDGNEFGTQPNRQWGSKDKTTRFDSHNCVYSAGLVALRELVDGFAEGFRSG
jgi:hypothetical protein